MEVLGSLGCIAALVVVPGVVLLIALVMTKARQRSARWNELAAVPTPTETRGEGRVRSEELSQAVPRRGQLQATSTRSKAASPVGGTGTARWLTPGQTFSVGKRTIEAPWLWVGRQMPAPGHYGLQEAALINPSLKVDFGTPDKGGDGMTYWPRYDSIEPRCRAAYLNWLAGGRSDPAIGIGYVFLYFYGIERRLLVDLLPSDSKAREVDELVAEVKRLRGIYGENGSFSAYSARLLELVNAEEVVARNPEEMAPPLADDGWQVPLSVKVAIGKLLASEEPVSAEWALAWALHHREVSLRTPAVRCREELVQLFKVRFGELHPGGLSIRAPKQRLRIEYRPASPSLLGVDIAAEIDLPDIGAMSAPIQRLRSLIDSCSDDLAAYSRWVGKNPDKRGTLAAAALLPRDLIRDLNSPRPFRICVTTWPQLLPPTETSPHRPCLRNGSPWRPASGPSRTRCSCAKYSMGSVGASSPTFALGDLVWIRPRAWSCSSKKMRRWLLPPPSTPPPRSRCTWPPPSPMRTA